MTQQVWHPLAICTKYPFLVPIQQTPYDSDIAGSLILSSGRKIS